MERFEEHLDIRSFVSIHTNLALLLSMLLTKEQLLLFKNHRVHSINEESEGNIKDFDKIIKRKKDILKEAVGSF